MTPRWDPGPHTHPTGAPPCRYNAKVWAHPANEMNHIWVGERVAEINSSKVFSNVIEPSQTFSDLL